MRKTTLVERRKAERLNVKLPVQYRIYSGDKPMSGSVFTDNISGTGVKFTLDTPLRQNDTLDLHVYFPDDTKPIVSTSRVVWCKKIETKKHLYFKAGVELKKITPDDRERFVFLFCETMLNYHLHNK